MEAFGVAEVGNVEHDGYQVSTLPYYLGNGSDLFVLMLWEVRSEASFKLFITFDVSGDTPVLIGVQGHAINDKALRQSYTLAADVKKDLINSDSKNPPSILRWFGSDLRNAWDAYRQEKKAKAISHQESLRRSR